MSQCSRVLEVLRDGRPHSIQEIHERAGTMRLNSRVADLRRMGFHVIYYRENGLHTYQLIDGTVRAAEVAGSGGDPPSAPLREPPRPTSAGGSSPVLSAEAGTTSEAGPDPEFPSQGQLLIWEAA